MQINVEFKLNKLIKPMSPPRSTTVLRAAGLPGLAALQRLRLIIQTSLLAVICAKQPEHQEDSTLDPGRGVVSKGSYAPKITRKIGDDRNNIKTTP